MEFLVKASGHIGNQQFSSVRLYSYPKGIRDCDQKTIVGKLQIRWRRFGESQRAKQRRKKERNGWGLDQSWVSVQAKLNLSIYFSSSYSLSALSFEQFVRVLILILLSPVKTN